MFNSIQLIIMVLAFISHGHEAVATMWEPSLESVTTPIRWLTKKKTNLSREEHYQGAIRTSFCSKIPTSFVEKGKELTCPKVTVVIKKIK
ncbi:hypothetical protein Tco_1440525 [Tanacetum coccineum]